MPYVAYALKGILHFFAETDELFGGSAILVSHLALFAKLSLSAGASKGLLGFVSQ